MSCLADDIITVHPILPASHRFRPPSLTLAARKLWSSYFPQVDAVVYLVDAMDRERFPEAKKELDVSTPLIRVTRLFFGGQEGTGHAFLTANTIMRSAMPLTLCFVPRGFIHSSAGAAEQRVAGQHAVSHPWKQDRHPPCRQRGRAAGKPGADGDHGVSTNLFAIVSGCFERLRPRGDCIGTVNTPCNQLVNRV